MLDTLRKQRHVTESSGDLIPESAALAWLLARHPDLLN